MYISRAKLSIIMLTKLITLREFIVFCLFLVMFPLKVERKRNTEVVFDGFSITEKDLFISLDAIKSIQ